MTNEFKIELEHLLNRHSVDNTLNVPDYILAKYITDQLAMFQLCLVERDKWFGFKPFERTVLGVKEGEK